VPVTALCASYHEYDPLLSRISFRIMCAGDPTGRAFYGVGLRQLACWYCGFGSRRGRGCLSFVSVLVRQAEVSASDRLLVKRSPTECDVSACDREASRPTRGRFIVEKLRSFMLSVTQIMQC
jgi:hypothetical protein